MMNQSDDLHDLYTALSMAQGEIENATKDAENPAFKRGNVGSKYADLASVRDAYRLPFSKHGLVLLQIPTTDGKRVSVLTRVAHKSGQFIEESLTMNAANETPHAIGSTITYLRRYAAMCFTGLAPEEDDGNAASLPATESSQEPSNERNIDDERQAIERANKAARKYVDDAIAWFAKVADADTLSAWWKREREPMGKHFAGKEDPLYAELRKAFVDRGAALTEGAKPSIANIDVEKLFNQFRDDLKLAADEASCNAIYASLIEPHEAQLSSDTMGELTAILHDRVDRVNTPQ